MPFYLHKRLWTVALAVAASALTSQMQADDLGYLRLVKTTGETAEVKADGLVITFQDGQLVATPAEGEALTLPLADMESMYFASGSTGIDLTPRPAAKTETTGIYTLDGRHIPAGTALPKGIYVTRQQGETRKIIVK